MATAATPLSARPTSARISRTPCQLGASALPTVNTAAASRDATSTCLRPMASEIGPVISRPTARVSVESERIRLLCAALMPNACDSMGIIGCTQ